MNNNENAKKAFIELKMLKVSLINLKILAFEKKLDFFPKIL